MKTNTYLYLGPGGEHCFYRYFPDGATLAGRYSSSEALMANMKQATSSVRGRFRIESGVPDQFKDNPKFRPMDEKDVAEVIRALKNERPILSKDETNAIN